MTVTARRSSYSVDLALPISRVQEREREREGVNERVSVYVRESNKLWYHKFYTPDAACTLAEMYALTHVRDAQYTTTINR